MSKGKAPAPITPDLTWTATEYRLHAGNLSARVYPGPGKGWRWVVYLHGPSGWEEKDKGDGATAEQAMGRAQAAIGRPEP